MLSGTNFTPSGSNAMLGANEAATKLLQNNAIAAEKVESMFASMLIKTLRETLGEEGLFPGDKSDALGSLFDQYLGDEIARGRGLGLADELVVRANQSSVGESL